MSDLNERLKQVLRAIEPGQAPVAAAMERGRRIRSRRRAAVIAGSVAVIAAAVATGPAIAHFQALPGPSASHVRVTVNPPGPGSPAGQVASGMLGSKPWSLRIESPGTKSCVVTGTNMPRTGCAGPGHGIEGALPELDPADPITLETAVTNDAYQTGRISVLISYGVVRQDVSLARVVLGDGTVLTLHPVTVGGARYVAFANRYGLPVESVTAFSRTGEIATAIPFDSPNGIGGPTFVTWLRPGQAGPRRATVPIGGGLTAYLGPWGLCLGGGPECYAWPRTWGRSTRVMDPSSPAWGVAAPDVAYLMVVPAHGTPVRVGVTTIGQQKFFAFDDSRLPEKGLNWTAYDSAGKEVASGPVFPAVSS